MYQEDDDVILPQFLRDDSKEQKQCQYCFKLFGHLKTYNITDHEKYCGLQKKKCKFCTKSFDSVSHLGHERSCGGRMLGCDFCSKYYSNLGSLSHHIKLIHNPKDVTVKCDKCGKTFANSEYLSKHKRNVMCRPDKVRSRRGKKSGIIITESEAEALMKKMKK